MAIPYTPGSQPPIGHNLVTDIETGERFWVGPDELKWKDAPVSELTKDQEDRIKRLQWALKEHDHTPLDIWIRNFRCGVDPEAEIKVYEAILKTYREELAERKTATKRDRHLLYHTILNASFRETLDNLLCAFPAAKGLSQLQRVFARYKEKVGTSDRIEMSVRQDNADKNQGNADSRFEVFGFEESIGEEFGWEANPLITEEFGEPFVMRLAYHFRSQFGELDYFPRMLPEGQKRKMGFSKLSDGRILRVMPVWDGEKRLINVDFAEPADWGISDGQHRTKST